MFPSDQEYFRARAEEERQRASQATARNIANIHLELAAKYDELVGLHAPTVDGRDTDESPWNGSLRVVSSRDDFDPDDPALQNEVAERLSAAADRMRRGLEG